MVGGCSSMIFKGQAVKVDRQIYSNELKVRKFGKEAAHILGSGASGIVRRQGASEDLKCVAKPTLLKFSLSARLSILTFWEFGGNATSLHVPGNRR